MLFGVCSGEIPDRFSGSNSIELYLTPFRADREWQPTGRGLTPMQRAGQTDPGSDTVAELQQTNDSIRTIELFSV